MMGVFMGDKGMRRSAAQLALAGLAALAGASLLGCHHHKDGPDNTVQAPVVSYTSPVILATAGEPFTSVAPEAKAYVHFNGVGTIVTTGITFTVSPSLPAGLSLGSTTGVISGTPQAAGDAVTYTIFASNSGGTGYCTLSLGVQASSPVTLGYGTSPNAAAGQVGAALWLDGPTVSGATATGFGVTPSLPAGLTLNRTTGLVSGTPTTADAGTTYTLTATTPAGSANATFTLLVAAGASAAPVGLACDPLVATAGAAFTGPVPTLTSGTGVVYTISPALPTGLALNPLTGQVTGTPAAASAQADYVLTASNAVGSQPLTLQVTVN
jgi:hypothetical protein